jgi:hypothetical protein
MRRSAGGHWPGCHRSQVRRHVEGRIYATLADKVAAVNAFLDELDADPARVRSLCGWDWITAAIASLPEPLEKAA